MRTATPRQMRMRLMLLLSRDPRTACGAERCARSRYAGSPIDDVNQSRVGCLPSHPRPEDTHQDSPMRPEMPAKVWNSGGPGRAFACSDTYHILALARPRPV